MSCSFKNLLSNHQLLRTVMIHGIMFWVSVNALVVVLNYAAHSLLNNCTGSSRLASVIASQTSVDLLTAGDHSFIQEECKACAISLLQADTLPEGLHRWQLPDFAGGLHLVRGEQSSTSHHVL